MNAPTHLDNWRYVSARRVQICGKAVEVVAVLLFMLAVAATILIGSEADWDEHAAASLGGVLATGLQLVTPTLVLWMLGAWAQSYALTRLGELER